MVINMKELFGIREGIREFLSSLSRKELEYLHDTLSELTDKCLDLLLFFREDIASKHKPITFYGKRAKQKARDKILYVRDLAFDIINGIELELMRRQK